MLQENEIVQELKSMDGTLASLSRKTPYIVSDDYFSSLPAAVLTKAVEASLTNSLPRSSPYAVPSGYFEQMPQQILSKTKSQQERHQTKFIPLGNSIWKGVRWAAAAALLIAAGFGTLQMLNSESSVEQKLASLPADAVIEYVRENRSGFDVAPAELALETGHLATTQLTEEEITRYLDEMGWQ